MSEEKLYAVKNDDGEWADSHHFFGSGAWATPDKAEQEEDAKRHGGHVVTLVEEPEKVVLTKAQAELVEEAHDSNYPASYISGSADDEKLIMKAFVSGYTVAKKKKYNVKVPHTEDVWYYKSWTGSLQTVYQGNNKLRGEFTEKDIEHYGLQDCEKVECDW